ncbi:small basic family protein [Salipaludibacillus sp. LMS25]|jgi:small basic protein|uniref:small basic family protein n=1 Tax=Salipaludibacillus sp. LMS25 TaxID=2924031 RepID=UPI0020D13D67|nr:small basic family protein [Salipaludibacillus sp. LMS25]UTR15181.1 small basic family protein [Salipaludibacillus sp. LMS25]
MWLPIFGLFFGLLLGFFTDFQISEQYASYFSIAVLAALDTLVGGIRANLEKQFDERIFISGFFTNIFLAAGLAFLGVHIGVDLYLAAIFAFGVRLFNNIAIIRRIFLDRWTNKQNKISTPRSK